MNPEFIWLACFVLISYTTLAISGFGSIIIAITLGVHLYPIKVLLPILVPLTLLVNSYITIKYRQNIDTVVLFRRIIPFMGVGLLLGIFVFQFIEGLLLKKIFGCLVVLLSLRQIFRLSAQNVNPPFTPNRASSLYILAAGIIHGIYASGGPLLVYAINRLGLNKTAFRSTLSSLWLILNIVLTSSYVITGKVNGTTLKSTAWLMPVVLVGLVLGEILHQHINEHTFKVFVFLILLLSGLSILVG